MGGFLAEMAASETATIAGAVSAFTLAATKGLSVLGGRIARRNGKGDCCHGKGCDRLTVIETKQGETERAIQRIDGNIGEMRVALLDALKAK